MMGNSRFSELLQIQSICNEPIYQPNPFISTAQKINIYQSPNQILLDPQYMSILQTCRVKHCGPDLFEQGTSSSQFALL